MSLDSGFQAGECRFELFSNEKLISKTKGLTGTELFKEYLIDPNYNTDYKREKEIYSFHRKLFA